MAEFTPRSSLAFCRHCLTGDDVLEDESCEADSDSDESDNSFCDLSDSEDGCSVNINFRVGVAMTSCRYTYLKILYAFCWYLLCI